MHSTKGPAILTDEPEEESGAGEGAHIMVAEKWNPNPGSGWTKRAKSLLSNSKIPAIRQVGVEWNSVGVVLRGQVHLYYYKQLAQELVRNELEDIPIFNEIEVVEHKSPQCS
jgi:hypothetical protein